MENQKTLNERILQRQKEYRDYTVKREIITPDEIRAAVVGEYNELTGIDVFIRIALKRGSTEGSGYGSKSAAMGAKYEYYAFMDGEIYKIPFFAPDYRYLKKTGKELTSYFELEDVEKLAKAELYNQKLQISQTKSFRNAYPEDAAKHDEKHGSENWWVEGNRKTGYTVYFKQ